MGAQPWLADANYKVLQYLFHLIRHRSFTDTLFDFVTFNHLVSTWIFAAVFYVYWQIRDEQTKWRRTRLTQIVVAFAIAVLITLAVRPWISWPAPSLNPRFQSLYPNYFWGNGSQDSFPSHATLAYIMIALGMWPFSRRFSTALVVVVLAWISFPRMFVGGHYPIDVAASLVLGSAMVLLGWRWRVPNRFSDLLVATGRASIVRELLVIFWVFELGEEFRGITNLVFHIRHYYLR
jgi:membrane-associated phospholipid phosphatase